MFQTMSTWSLKEGISVDELWNYHTQVHAADALKVSTPGFLRYVISRVTKVLEGNPAFFDLIELWYENEDAMIKQNDDWEAALLPNGKKLTDDFLNWVTDYCGVVVEQFVAKDISPKVYADMQVNKLVEMGITYLPKESVDADEFWKYHTQVKAGLILEVSGPGLSKYVISRVVRVRDGEPKFYHLAQLYWDSEEAMNRDIEAWKDIRLDNGKSLPEDLASWITSSSSFMIEEFIAKEYRP